MTQNRVIPVQLEMYFEQGMEGIEWAVYDNTKQGYDGLIVLNEGDYLEISNVWAGYIKYDLESCNSCHNYFNYPRQMVEGYILNWLQKDVDPSLWLQWFRQELPAYYCKANVN